MADRPSRVGQQLGNYRLLQLLGEGGFAEVYLGEHTYLGTHAAIKILYTRVAQDNIGQFQREARMLANLIHPHIVRVLDFGVADRTPYLVMDYAPNGTLRTRHPKGTPLAVATVVSYVKQCAQALQYAHDQKIIHRDVKPENMLIGRNGEILLSDFGIALVAQSSRYQSTKDMAGTITYMAPEQIEAHPRPASDQYSLGIVTYEWLSGNRPFHGSFTEIAAKHSVIPPPSLCQQLPDLSPEIEQVVFTALAKKPEGRFASVRVFATALEQSSQSGQSQPLGLPRPVTPPSQPEQIQPSVPLPAVTPVHQPLPTTILVTPPNRTPKPMTEVPSLNLSSHVSEVPDTRLPIPQPMSRPSRRAVIAGLVGLTLIGSGITWFVISQKPTPKLTHRITPTPLPIGTLLYTYKGHSAIMDAVAWSPDGKRIASGSWDKTVQVWNASDGSSVLTYRGHSNDVRTVAWSPDGKRIASGSYDKTVQVWDAVDGRNVYTYKGHSDMVQAVAWSPDGKRIASGSYDKTVQVWDSEDGRNVYTYKGHSSYVNAVAWSLDGKRIASGSDDSTVQMWDATDGGNAFTYHGHSGWVNAVAWSPDGKRIASASWDKTVQVWDAVDGSHVYTYKGHHDVVYAIAWSPDGKRIASGSGTYDRTVQVWDAVDGGNVYTYKGHSWDVLAVAWSPDGKRIASASEDNTVQVWVVS
jgi:serine/threonine protein kinase/Tol biopolymer transport system component